MVDIHALSYFKLVAELQHLTKAAEELRVAQPSLSRTIAGLEEELGVKLFDRVGKNIQLNRCGEIVLRHTNNILQELRDIQAELADEQERGGQTVTISVYAASRLLPQLISEFKAEYPNIRLRMIQQSLMRASQEECDVSIFASIPPANEECTTPLIEEEIYLAIPEDSPLARKENIRLRDTADMEFICLHKGKSLRTITDMYCQLAGFTPQVVLECDSPEMVRGLINAKVGISFVPSITWSGMDTRNILLRHIDFPSCTRYINLGWRGGYLSPSAVLFRDFVQDFFADLRLNKQLQQIEESHRTLQTV